MFTKFVLGVNVFIFGPSGDFVVGRRRGSYDAGTWGLPGGHLDLGETFNHCAAREVFEETGIDIAPDKFTVLTATNDLDDPDGLHYVTIFVACRLPSQRDGKLEEPKTLEPEKCEGWRWWSWNDLQKAGQDERASAQLSEPLRNLMKQMPTWRLQLHQLQSRESQGLRPEESEILHFGVDL